MAKVEVRATKTFLLDAEGVSYEKGDTFSVDEQTAKRIVDAGAGELVKEEKRQSASKGAKQA